MKCDRKWELKMHLRHRRIAGADKNLSWLTICDRITRDRLKPGVKRGLTAHTQQNMLVAVYTEQDTRRSSEAIYVNANGSDIIYACVNP